VLPTSNPVTGRRKNLQNNYEETRPIRRMRERRDRATGGLALAKYLSLYHQPHGRFAKRTGIEEKKKEIGKREIRKIHDRASIKSNPRGRSGTLG